MKLFLLLPIVTVAVTAEWSNISPIPTAPSTIAAQVSDRHNPLNASVSQPTDRLSHSPAPKQSVSIAALEQQVLEQINKHRAAQGLPALTMDARISAIARRHSQNMASGSIPFSHHGARQRYERMGEIFTWRQVAENVSYNYGHADPVNVAMVGWLDSTGHRDNIEGNFDYTGIGVAVSPAGEYYFTQLFLRRR